MARLQPSHPVAEPLAGGAGDLDNLDARVDAYSVFAYLLNEFEPEILRERVRAGLAHARQNGKRLGRPVTAARKQPQVLKLFAKGISKAEIARRLAIGRTSVLRMLVLERRRDV